jgi:hypothetical protein
MEKYSRKVKRVRKRLKCVIQKQNLLVTQQALHGEKMKIQKRFERMEKERVEIPNQIVEESAEIKTLALLLKTDNQDQ